MSEVPLRTVCTHGDKLRLDTDDWVEGSTLAWGMVAFVFSWTRFFCTGAPRS